MSHCHRPPHGPPHRPPHGGPHRPPHGPPVAICPPHIPEEKFAVIRNQKSGLVLDATEYEVKLQHFTGFPAQLWKLEEAGNGNVFIVNKGNGKVLDIQGGPKCGAKLITYQRHGGVNQQWSINSDETIVGAQNLAVDISENRFSPGTALIAYRRHGKDNQKFHLQNQ